MEYHTNVSNLLNHTHFVNLATDYITVVVPSRLRHVRFGGSLNTESNFTPTGWASEGSLPTRGKGPYNDVMSLTFNRPVSGFGCACVEQTRQILNSF